MGNKIVITKKDDQVITCLIGERELLQIQVDKSEGTKLLGNIYLGKVKNIVKNINAAFVEIENKQMCYLPLGNDEHPVFAEPSENKGIRIGDELIVQVIKEDIKTKSPMVTADFTLTGKYLVLVHGRPMLGISSKITDEKLRRELKKTMKPYISERYGFIVRTNAQGAPLELIERELLRLKQDYESLVTFGIHWNCFSRLYTTPPSYIWDIRDGYSDTIDEIKTDDKDIYDSIYEYMSRVQDEDMGKLVLYRDDKLSLTKLYSIERKLEQALSERVWLDSGAYLVIQPTEALTVIDVNSGKAIAGRNKPEETFAKVNMEAAEMIARQIRLRNLSGIIIVDFIDMQEKEHVEQLLMKLERLLKEDPVPTQLIDITKLNLVEITRKKVRKPLHESVKGI